MNSALGAVSRTLKDIGIPVEKWRWKDNILSCPSLSLQGILSRLERAHWVVASTAEAEQRPSRDRNSMAPRGKSFILYCRDPHFEGMAIEVEDGGPVLFRSVPWSDSYSTANDAWLDKNPDFIRKLNGELKASTRMQIATALRAAADKLMAVERRRR